MDIIKSETFKNLTIINKAVMFLFKYFRCSRELEFSGDKDNARLICFVKGLGIQN